LQSASDLFEFQELLESNLQSADHQYLPQLQKFARFKSNQKNPARAGNSSNAGNKTGHLSRLPLYQSGNHALFIDQQEKDRRPLLGGQ